MNTQHLPYCDFIFLDQTLQFFGVPAGDGTSIAVQRSGNPENPPLIIGNGIGVRYWGLHEITSELSKDFCVYTWDYRGIGDSTEVATEDYSLSRHGQDALEIMNWFGYEKFHVAGWSMGVGVIMEMFRKSPQSILTMSALFGATGKPFSKGAFFEKGIFGLLGMGSKHPFLPIFVKKAVSMNRKALISFLKRIGFASFRSNPILFEMCVDGVLATDTEIYTKTLFELGKQDASDLLGKINIPFYAAGGGKDWVTPHKNIEEAVRCIPESRYSFFPEASHFGIMEDSPRLTSEIREFIKSSTP
ncbi:alpha/beta hydrolase [Myxococcota bacterium]|nr:alpha/beta hydrolase [Myxococcota bacterium]